VPFVIDPVLPAFRARHPRVEVEVDVEVGFVDIVAEGYDAGVRAPLRLFVDTAKELAVRTV
jgi:DNA-binding transcriptional LysR family regulator